MSVVSFRIDPKKKKQMEELKHLNWSEILRNFLEKKIEEESAYREINYSRRTAALRELNALQAQILPEDNWNSTEELRKWREKRK